MQLSGYIYYLILLFCAASFCGCSAGQTARVGNKTKMDERKLEIMKTEEEWKKILTAEQYAVLREKSTERPFTGKYYNYTKDGIYSCAGCGAELFSSSDKFNAGCGWPSFSDVIKKGTILTSVDTSYGMVRTEITCARCGGHLGHLFEDGPTPTGLRYCVNSASLNFNPENNKSHQE